MPEKAVCRTAAYMENIVMSERKWELDVVRAIACFFVVVIHVASYGMEIKDPATIDWIIRNGVLCLVKCSVPIFFMLSGILFMEKEITIKVLYRKYIARIVVAWAVWSAFYAAIDQIAYLKSGGEGLTYFAVRFVAGHYHMWFLPAILIVYIFLPVLQKLITSCSPLQMKYLGIVFLVGVIGKETFTPFIHNEIWDRLWENFSLPFASVGIIYFVLGYYLYKNYDRFSAKTGLLIYLVCCLLMAGINMAYAFMTGKHTSAASQNLSLGMCISSAMFFIFLLQVFSDCKFSERWKAWFKSVSDYTFGIYLLHTLFIEQVYRRIGLSQDNFPVVFSIILFSVLTFAISFLVVWCIRKIPVLGKWIL